MLVSCKVSIYQVLSLDPPFRRRPLCNIRAIGLLDSLAVFHQATHPLPQLYKRGIVLFDDINGIPEELRYVVGGGSARQKIDGKAVPESKRVRIGKARALAKGYHPIVEPRASQRLTRFWIQKHAVPVLWLAAVPLRLKGEEQLLAHRQYDALFPLLSESVCLPRLEIDFIPGQPHSVRAPQARPAQKQEREQVLTGRVTQLRSMPETV